jgi:D-alanine-D-alanine ligase
MGQSRLERKLNIVVLMGGPSSEHDISLKTGAKVVEALSKDKYNVKPVTITRDGRWLLPETGLTLIGDESEPDASKPVKHAGPVKKINRTEVDAVFVALHGPYGEDGKVQALLEMMDIPYTGSGVCASALAMHKLRCKQLVAYHGICVPREIVVEERDWESNAEEVVARVTQEIGFPCVVKPIEQGSSVGMGIPQDEDELRRLMPPALDYEGRAMVEEFVKGRELTCSVLGGFPGEEPFALPVTEIIPVSSTFFDYEAKYTPGASREITPAALDQETTERAQKTAVHVHTIVGAGSMSRTDMILSENDNEPYFLEINTIPGMTETSLLPQAAAAAGISFPELLDRLVQVALATHEETKRSRRR